jgi:hypothetical protein
MCWPDKRLWIFIFLILNSFSDFSRAQRIFLPPTPEPIPETPQAATAQAPPISTEPGTTLVLKTYPDGTKKIVPLEALNFRDDGQAFGGPPRLSIYQEPSPHPSTISTKSPERLSVAPIGTTGTASSVTANLPPSADPMGGSITTMAAADPMGGGPASDPMGGGISNPMGGAPAATNPLGGNAPTAPLDPLGGSGTKTAPPLQTVSGKPAPLVGDSTTLQLGEWESFFLNAGIGGALQGQLTARRIWNGNNRQAYPYGGPGTLPPPPAPYNQVQVSAENFTFQPGFRVDMEFGYNFYEWLGVGLQTGITYNGISQYGININQPYTVGTQTFQPGSYHFSADGELIQVPIQINGILRWPGQMKLRPFIGGGIGAIWQQLDVNNYYAGPFDVQANYCRSGFQFGWNAQVGATYTVEPGLDFYGAFKMLSAFMPVIGNYQFENSYNFAVEVGIQSRF